MADVEYEISGLEEWCQTFSREVLEEFPRVLEDITYEAGQELACMVRAKTPKVTGTLQNGWTVGPVQKRGNEYTVEVGNEVPYASFVEYGHKQEPGRFVPAIEKRLKADFVRGKFMMTDSIEEFKGELPEFVEERLGRFLDSHGI